MSGVRASSPVAALQDLDTCRRSRGGGCASDVGIGARGHEAAADDLRLGDAAASTGGACSTT
jgi:hypothetical protein